LIRVPFANGGWVVTSNGKTKGSLVVLAAAALASSVTLAPANALAPTLAALPAEAAGVGNDALIRVAHYDAVRRQDAVHRQYVIRPLKKPRYLPPNPCRSKSNMKRC
jgi:hypothetical protein